MTNPTLEQRTHSGSPAGVPDHESHAEVVPAAHPVVRYNPDAPSEAWGWHGSWREMAPIGSRVMLWIGVAVLFLMIHGNHVSRVEDWWLGIIGVLMAIWLLWRDAQVRRRRRRRP